MHMAEKTVPTMNKEENQVVKREITRNPDYYATPLVDIFETQDGLTVVADLPGVEKTGLKVQVEDGILTIEGKIGESKREHLLIKEFEPVNFFRQFEISEIIDQERISAELKHGVLTLNLPKAEAAKPKQIEVTVG
jgi:HSP20 family molecular chaperone IbpA